MKKAKPKKAKKFNKNLIFGLGSLLLIAVLFLVIGLGRSGINPTGSSVYVVYYGLDNQLMDSQAGKMQTYIKLNQPTLEDLANPATRAEVTEDILKATNFAQGIVDSYNLNPPFYPVNLETLEAGAADEANNFRENQVCLEKMGGNQGHWGEIELVLISELNYRLCSNQDRLAAFVRHTFFDKSSGGFICSQDDKILFFIDKTTGKLNFDATGC